MNIRVLRSSMLVLTFCCVSISSTVGRCGEFHIAPFSVDVTIPLGHRCMGVLPVKAKEVVDPLYARGFVLTGGEKPVVYVAVDWCEIRNASYDAWRDAIAEAATTSRDRVLVSSVHQHDAPVVDRAAQQLLDSVGLEKELYDEEFHETCLQKVGQAVRESLKQPRRVTSIGFGQAKVAKVASNRRIVDAQGRASYTRNSGSAGDAVYRDAPEGEIDPYLKTISFWNQDVPVVALHVYATHPMSFYGAGGVSADFVGLARKLRSTEQPGVLQIYASGCSGDVTAGKYNDRTPLMRSVLAQRLLEAMRESWTQSKQVPLERVEFRNEEVRLSFRAGAEYSADALQQVLESKARSVSDRILAAMALSSRQRIESGRTIDLPCVDLGPVQLLVLPGESFVGFQLKAQSLRPDSFVVCAGYGECWTGYIPTQKATDEGFTDTWLWAGDGSAQLLEAAVENVLRIAP